MAYTCGAATTDDVGFNSTRSLGGDNTSTFVCGWWYPTTLTATRGYWSAGNTYGAEIDGTTSEIRMRTDNTTDGQWVTSGAGITTNKWWFIAWLNATENTTVAGAWRVWVGDLENQPVAVTVTNPTVRSGNYTASATCVMGNKGTGSLAFQGDLGWLVVMVQQAAGLLGPAGVITSGVIDADVEARAYRRWVLPFWQGRPDVKQFWYANDSSAWSMTYLSLDFGTRMYTRAENGTDANGLAALNGVTKSQQRAPIVLHHAWMSQHPWVRR